MHAAFAVLEPEGYPCIPSFSLSFCESLCAGSSSATSQSRLRRIRSRSHVAVCNGGFFGYFLNYFFLLFPPHFLDVRHWMNRLRAFFLLHHHPSCKTATVVLLRRKRPDLSTLIAKTIITRNGGRLDLAKKVDVQILRCHDQRRPAFQEAPRVRGKTQAKRTKGASRSVPQRRTRAQRCRTHQERDGADRSACSRELRQGSSSLRSSPFHDVCCVPINIETFCRTSSIRRYEVDSGFSASTSEVDRRARNGSTAAYRSSRRVGGGTATTAFAAYDVGIVFVSN